MTFHPGSPAFGLPPQRQIPDAPRPDMAALLYQVSRVGSHETDPDWTCPGCGRLYEDLPAGHSWSYGTAPGVPGNCSDVSLVEPHQFAGEPPDWPA